MKKVLFIAVLFLSAMLVAAQGSKRGFAKIEVVVHRGANFLAPENTVASADSALAHGATWIEVDVRPSRDGVLYNMHDPTLDRTTNGRGAIADMKSAEINRLDAGSWFDASFLGTRVPTIAAMLDALRGRANVFFDVKKGTQVAQLVKLVRRKGYARNSFFWFGDTLMLKEFVRIAPDMKVKVNASTVDGIKRWMRICRPSYIEIAPEAITDDVRRFCREAGIKIMAAIQGSGEQDYREVILRCPDLVNLDRPELFSRIQAAMSGKTAAVPANMGLQWERYGGVYRAYPESRHTYTAAPAGYTAFYISHFARHGSRWLPDDRRYEAVLEQFADTLNLTPLGLDVRHRLLKIYADARGRGGDLTSVGAAQHDRMALRMVQNFPSVFTDSALVSARSSTVGRCVMSMNAFLISLARTRPAVRITAEANRRYMDYIAYTSTEERLLEDTVRNIWLMNPRRLMSTLFRDLSRIAAPRDLASELHTIASDMQNTDIGVSLYDIFTEAEMRQIYDMNNRRMQRCNGINSLNGGTPERCAASLWRNIETSADSAVCRRLPSATLRFGHDTSLYRLLSLLGLFAGESRMDVIIPMGANLQIIFYRNRANDVIVKFMHNEREIVLPGMSSELPAPYYRWADVRRAVNRRLAELGM